MRILTAVLLAVLLVPGTARAQSEGEPASEAPASRTSATDTTTAADTTAAESDADWLILPYASYAPETKIAGGIVFGFYPATPAGQRPSSIQMVLTYTQRNQAIAQIDPEVYFGGGQWRVEGSVEASEYPDSFYGIGGDTPASFEQTYTSRYGFADLSLQRIVLRSRFGDDLFAGGRLHVRYETDPETDASVSMPDSPAESGGQLLLRNAVPGADGGWTAGAGTRLTLDRRDNLNDPTDGTYADVSATWYSAVLGSDFTFGRAKVDLRRYQPLGRGVLAGNVYAEGVMGTAPFQLLPLLGGSSRMRGYREGRFRDDVYWTAQVAYRVPLFWRFGAVAFAGAGEVGPRIGGDLVQDVELAVGVGGRLRLTDGGVNGRLDLAYSASGLQLYISLGEAF